MKIENMLGYKIFKEVDDDLILYRITKIRKPASGESPSEVTVRDDFTGEEKKIRVEELKDFTPLEPDAYITFNTVHVLDGKKPLLDVVVTASKILNLKIGDTVPYAICRQSVTDVFYNLMSTSENDMLVGISINQDTCPTNFQFPMFLACDGIDQSQYVNYYRTDTIADIMYMIKTTRMDEILHDNFIDHAKAKRDSSIAFKKEDGGWCKDLNTLLTQNCFQADVDQMLGITAVEFDVNDYIIKKDLPNGKGQYNSFNQELMYWLSLTYNVGMTDITVIEYGHDINLADFNNTRYIILRDKNKKVYVCAYTIGDQQLLLDMQEKAKELTFLDKFRLEFYNKYNDTHRADE